MKARRLLYTTLLVVMLLVHCTLVSVSAQSGEEWLGSPVEGSSQCGAGFGESNPLGAQSFHNAIDIACGMGGATVRAVASGEVVWSDFWPIGIGDLETGHGRTVIVFHPETNLYTYYAHLGDFNVSKGDEVKRGSVVGHVGNSGYVLKPDGYPNFHLHFAVRNTGPEDGNCWDLSCWKNPDNYLGTLITGESESQSKNTEDEGEDEKQNEDQDEDENQNGNQDEDQDQDENQDQDESEESSSPGSEDQSDKSSSQKEVKYYSSGLVGTIDQVADTIRFVPNLRKYSDFWDKYKKYLPWVVAILIVVLFLTVFKPIVDFLAKSKWGRRRSRKKAEFFWLSIILLIIYRAEFVDQELISLLFEFTAGIWLFFTLTGLLNKLWRHFNYDPELEIILARGGVDGWEWLREIILAPVIYGVIVAILSFTLGFYWFRPSPTTVVQAEEGESEIVRPDSSDSSSEDEDSGEASPEPSDTDSDTDSDSDSTPASGSELQFNCDFDPIEAGLGPVKVGCDENGLPTFPIRWWNGNYFDFHIPLDLWEAVNISGASPKGMIGIIAFGSSESTGFTNYQSENYAGAAGTFQFLGGTFTHWAPEGFKDPSYRTDDVISSKAVSNMQTDGMNEIYNMTDQAEVESCFQGGSGCNTWNQHAEQANYVWRLMVALRVAAGLN